MTTKIIKKLAEQSFKKNELDTAFVQQVTAKIKSRKDIKSYLRALRLIQQASIVKVDIPTQLDEMIKQRLQSRFPDKKISYTENKDLLAGIRILENDILYDFSVQGKIDQLITSLYEAND